jgi:hypothetical protein
MFKDVVRFRVEIWDTTANPPEWVTNAIRYGDLALAEASGRALAGRWLFVRKWRLVGVDADENVVWEDKDRSV